MLDLSTLDTSAAAEQGAAMQVRHPATNAPLDEGGQPITVTLAGVDSERFRKAQRAVQNRRLKTGGRRSATISAEELDNEGLEIIVACTVSWSGIVLDGQPVDCTPANARAVYKRLPWLREQADEFMADRANFLKG